MNGFPRDDRKLYCIAGNAKKVLTKKLKKCRDDSCKSKGTRWDDSCKSKGTRWDDSCKSKGTRWDDTCKSKTHPSEPRPTLKCQVSTSAACHIISQMHHLKTERLYNIPYGQSSRKLKLARAEPSKLTTSSGKALETYN